MKNLFMYVLMQILRLKIEHFSIQYHKGVKNKSVKRKDQKLPKEFRVKLGFGLPK